MNQTNDPNDHEILPESSHRPEDAQPFGEEAFTEFFDGPRSNVVLPLYGTRVSCSFPSPADDYVEQYLSLDKELVKNPASTFFVRAQGECMRELIQHGDLLLIDRSLEPRNKKIVLAVLNGEFMIKRLIKGSKGREASIILRPENPVYNDIVVTPEMDFKIWGVVTYVIHPVDMAFASSVDKIEH